MGIPTIMNFWSSGESDKSWNYNSWVPIVSIAKKIVARAHSVSWDTNVQWSSEPWQYGLARLFACNTACFRRRGHRQRHAPMRIWGWKKWRLSEDYSGKENACLEEWKPALSGNDGFSTLVLALTANGKVAWSKRCRVGVNWLRMVLPLAKLLTTQEVQKYEVLQTFLPTILEQRKRSSSNS